MVSLKTQQFKRILILFFIFSIAKPVYSQVYTEKQTKHRFAQLNLGLDFQSSFGGTTKYLDAQGNTQTLNLANSYSPRFIIGGTHFWGHADFYIAIPLYSPTIKNNIQEITSPNGVETVFKYYPFRIENNKVRPYIGTAFAPKVFEHQNNNFQYSSGPELNYTSFPLLFGLTFNSRSHLIEFGISWDYRNSHDYYISRSQIEQIKTTPFCAALSYRYMLETTMSAEKDWESGRTKEVTNF